jgi:general secretion pathway protein I
VLQSSAENSPPGPASGFTLVEALVAFAVAAVLLAALFPALSTSLQVEGRADGEHRAVLWAESLIDAIGQSGPLQTGESSGTIDAATRWRARVRPLGTAPLAAGATLSAYEVTVEVTVEAPRGVTQAALTTVRIAKGPP